MWHLLAFKRTHENAFMASNLETLKKHSHPHRDFEGLSDPSQPRGILKRLLANEELCNLYILCLRYSENLPNILS